VSASDTTTVRGALGSRRWGSVAANPLVKELASANPQATMMVIGGFTAWPFRLVVR